jgi:hypothetical protein
MVVCRSDPSGVATKAEYCGRRNRSVSWSFTVKLAAYALQSRRVAQESVIEDIRPGLARWVTPHPEWKPEEDYLDESYRDVASVLHVAPDALVLVSTADCAFPPGTKTTRRGNGRVWRFCRSSTSRSRSSFPPTVIQCSRAEEKRSRKRSRHDVDDHSQRRRGRLGSPMRPLKLEHESIRRTLWENGSQAGIRAPNPVRQAPRRRGVQREPGWPSSRLHCACNRRTSTIGQHPSSRRARPRWR